MSGFLRYHTSGLLTGRARRRRWLMALVGMLTLAAVAPAHADNVVNGIAAAFDHVANIYLTLLVFNVVSWFIEAWILNRYLRLGYWKLFGLSALVNIVSTALGFFHWKLLLGFEGWKTAIVYGDWSRVGILFLRSFVITVAEEGLLLMVIVRGRARAVWRGVLAANLVTYVLAFVIMLIIR
jgi:hypothetical protein